MSSLPESEKLDEVGFEWGMRGGTGGRNRDVRFYKSFTYDGVDYALYDCVYMYKEGEPAPYIGKLLKIWENVDKSKKIKVQWFFRPSEMSNYLKDTEVSENELFFASGDGTGLANINPLEAIAGKCNVVCISTDSRNPQPSVEDLQTADYVFYRTFDVRSLVITNQIDDKVGGLEVQYVFNRRGGAGLSTVDGAKHDSNDKVEERDVVACRETLKLAGKNSTQQLNNVRLHKNSDHPLPEDTIETLVTDKQQSLLGECSGANVISSKNRENTGTTLEDRSMLGAENAGCNSIGKNEFKDINSLAAEDHVGEGVKSSRNSCDFDDALSMGAKLDTISSLKIQNINGVQNLIVSRNDAAHSMIDGTTSVDAKPKSELVKGSFACRIDLKLAGNSSFLDEKLSETKSSLRKEAQRSGHVEDALGLKKEPKLNKVVSGAATSINAKSEFVKDSVGCRRDFKLVENSSFLDEKLSKKKSCLSKEASRSGHVQDALRLNKESKLDKDFNASRGKLAKINSFASTEKLDATHSKDVVSIEKDNNSDGNFDARREMPSTSNGASCDKTPRPSSTNVTRNETPKSRSNKDFDGSQQATKLVQTSTTPTRRPIKRSADFFEEKSCPGHEKSQENKDKKLVSNSCPMEQGSLKKAKFDDTNKRLVNKDNTSKKLEKDSVGETTNSPKLVTSQDNKAKSRLDEVTLNKYHNEKGTKLPSDDLSNPSILRPKGGGKVGGLIEVTRRPIEKSKWIKLPWEEKMKTAHNEGRLVLLQNLDPEYSSGEVEDIIWHAFEEKCTARMVQRTAISNPYSGQAFVIFVSRKAVDRFLQKLDDGCLMLPNQRPLVACIGVLHMSSGKQTTFVGHLAVDKARRHQRLVKEAVATSHYSQNNTIEYEMAMDWRLLQLKSDKWWEMLYQQQRKELKKLKDSLKSKL